MEKTRKRPRQIIGVVVSDKMQKTITVKVERLVKHPQYKKYVKKFSTFYAHDEKEEASVGDKVELVPSRPLSKLKRWRLLRIVDKRETEK